MCSTEFRETVQTMLADPSYRQSAEVLSGRIAEYSGPNRVSEIAEQIESLL